MDVVRPVPHKAVWLITSRDKRLIAATPERAHYSQAESPQSLCNSLTISHSAIFDSQEYSLGTESGTTKGTTIT